MFRVVDSEKIVETHRI